MTSKYIFFFNDLDQIKEEFKEKGAVKGRIGYKAKKLAKLHKSGLPIPNGFTLTTEAFNEYYKQDGGEFTEEISQEITTAISKLEELTNKTFGKGENPLLVSCRYGTRASMHGVLPVYLSVGMNDEIIPILSEKMQNPRYVMDSYKKYIILYSTDVLAIDHTKFEEATAEFLTEKGVQSETELQNEDFEALVNKLKEIVQTETENPFPQEPIDQLKGFIKAMYASWNTDKAKEFRNEKGYSDDWGVAVTVMEMIYGNMGENSGTGVVITRDVHTGQAGLTGEFALSALGDEWEDKPKESISKLEEIMPEAYEKLTEICKNLEILHKNPQEVKFTIENGNLWVLQNKTLVPDEASDLKVTIELCKDEILPKSAAISKLSNEQFASFFEKKFDPTELEAATKFATANTVAPGIAVGQLCLDAAHVFESIEAAEEGVDLVLAITGKKVTPDDIKAISQCKAVIVAGNDTPDGSIADAAKAARIPALVNVGFKIDAEDRILSIGEEKTIKEDDPVTIDGPSGSLIASAVPFAKFDISEHPDIIDILKFCEDVIASSDQVKLFALAESADDAEQVKSCSGVGLFKIDSLFTGERSDVLGRLAGAEEEDERDGVAGEIEEAVASELGPILDAMSGKTVIVRLADVSPAEAAADVFELAEELSSTKQKNKMEGGDVDEEEMAEKEKALKAAKDAREENPVAGLRGARVLLTQVEFLEAQLKGVVSAAASSVENENEPRVTVVLPLTVSASEVAAVRPILEKVTAAVCKEREVKVSVSLGASIETPRAAMCAGEIAKEADSLIVCTQPLTQFALGMTRAGTESFVPRYIDGGVFKESPFEALDKGVARLARIAIDRARKEKPDIVCGVCGPECGCLFAAESIKEAGANFIACPMQKMNLMQLAIAHLII